jgi:hypothetical protein
LSNLHGLRRLLFATTVRPRMNARIAAIRARKRMS